jgi:hypothetical protein
MRKRSQLIHLNRFLAAIVCALVASGCTVLGPPAVDCPGLAITVKRADPQDGHDVCAAARLVFGFFRSLDLHHATPLSVDVETGGPTSLGPNVLGCFRADSRRIQVLPFTAAVDRGPWLGVPMDRVLYRSLAAHEIAHALTWCNAEGVPLSVRAREYVAYAVMFETMDPGHRQAVLDAYPGTGFASESEISDLFFYLAPSRFGVEAYRHFLRPENGPGFLQRIISGAALPVLDD